MGHGRLGLPPELPPCGQLDAKDPCCLQYDVMRTPPKHTDMLAEADYRAKENSAGASSLKRLRSCGRLEAIQESQVPDKINPDYRPVQSSLVFMSHWVMGLHRLSRCRTLIFSVFFVVSSSAGFWILTQAVADEHAISQIPCSGLAKWHQDHE